MAGRCAGFKGFQYGVFHIGIVAKQRPRTVLGKREKITYHRIQHGFSGKRNSGKGKILRGLVMAAAMIMIGIRS